MSSETDLNLREFGRGKASKPSSCDGPDSNAGFNE
jgi:hypothetical protein